VTDPQDHLVERGRAIFDRLRSGGTNQQDSTPEQLAAHSDDGASEAAVPADDLDADPAAAEAEDLARAEPDSQVSQGPDPGPGSDHSPPPAETAAVPADPGAAGPTDGPERSPLPGAADLAPFAEGPAEASAPATPAAPPAEAPSFADGIGASAPAPSPVTVPDPAADREPAPAAGPRPSPFARPLPRIMAIANQKGGVGKTTTAVNLGACLADLGYRVLVVDLDPQGNASTGLGINIRDLHGSMYDVILHDLPIDDCVEATSVRNLFVAPSSLDLAGAEIELVPAFSRELRLRRALEEVADDYDFVLVDCPPSLGLLTVNGLAAATEVVVPIQCEYYALEGLGQLLRNVNLVQRNLNPRLELSAIVLVMYDARTKLADQVVREVREHFGDKVCRNVVPRTVRLSEAPSFGQPIIAFDATSRGAIAYRELAKEVAGGAPQRAG
jgi:chromosome partitioning protein